MSMIKFRSTIGNNDSVFFFLFIFRCEKPHAIKHSLTLAKRLTVPINVVFFSAKANLDDEDLYSFDERHMYKDQDLSDLVNVACEVLGRCQTYSCCSDFNNMENSASLDFLSNLFPISSYIECGFLSFCGLTSTVPHLPKALSATVDSKFL